jgi:phage FluMu gp28-like protein
MKGVTRSTFATTKMRLATFINDCAFWAKTFNILASEVEEKVLKDENKDVLTFRIQFASGHEIKALSSNPNNIRGKAGRVVIGRGGSRSRPHGND